MGSIVVVESFPLGQFLVQINIVGVSQQLAELLAVGAVRSLDFAIELGRTRLDVDMTDPFIFNLPMKQSLKLVASIGSYGMDSEGELLDNVVNEVDGVFLCKARVALQRPNPGGVVDGRILETTNLSAIGIL